MSDNPKGILRPGMTVQASIDLEAEEEVFLVPRSAVVAEKQKGVRLQTFRGPRYPVTRLCSAPSAATKSQWHTDSSAGDTITR